jgi:hypothetical protein
MQEGQFKRAFCIMKVSKKERKQNKWLIDEEEFYQLLQIFSFRQLSKEYLDLYLVLRGFAVYQSIATEKNVPKDFEPYVMDEVPIDTFYNSSFNFRWIKKPTRKKLEIMLLKMQECNLLHSEGGWYSINTCFSDLYISTYAESLVFGELEF